jgi:predicted transposase YbfD/YdcC
MSSKDDAPATPRNLMECFDEMPDPRVDRTRDHKLIDILVIGLCTMITVGENFTDMEDFGKAKLDWLKTFLELPNGIPSHDTFNRVFSAIDPDQFLNCFVKWVKGMCPTLDDDVVSIDGKALRHAFNKGDTIPHIVSAWASRNGLVLGQVKVNDKSNEITAIPELLCALELEGCVVTIDAMGCQKDIAAEIIQAKADYVLALKGNHATVHEEFREYFDAHTAPRRHGLPRDRRESPRPHRDPALLAHHRHRLVPRQETLVCATQCGDGRIHP